MDAQAHSGGNISGISPRDTTLDNSSITDSSITICGDSSTPGVTAGNDTTEVASVNLTDDPRLLGSPLHHWPEEGVHYATPPAIPERVSALRSTLATIPYTEEDERRAMFRMTSPSVYTDEDGESEEQWKEEDEEHDYDVELGQPGASRLSRREYMTTARSGAYQWDQDSPGGNEDANTNNTREGISDDSTIPDSDGTPCSDKSDFSASGSVEERASTRRQRPVSRIIAILPLYTIRTTSSVTAIPLAAPSFRPHPTNNLETYAAEMLSVVTGAREAGNDSHPLGTGEAHDNTDLTIALSGMPHSVHAFYLQLFEDALRRKFSPVTPGLPDTAGLTRFNIHGPKFLDLNPPVDVTQHFTEVARPVVTMRLDRLPAWRTFREDMWEALVHEFGGDAVLMTTRDPKHVRVLIRHSLVLRPEGMGLLVEEMMARNAAEEDEEKRAQEAKTKVEENEDQDVKVKLEDDDEDWMEMDEA